MNRQRVFMVVAVCALLVVLLLSVQWGRDLLAIAAVLSLLLLFTAALPFVLGFVVQHFLRERRLPDLASWGVAAVLVALTWITDQPHVTLMGSRVIGLVFLLPAYAFFFERGMASRRFWRERAASARGPKTEQAPQPDAT